MASKGRDWRSVSTSEIRMLQPGLSSVVISTPSLCSQSPSQLRAVPSLQAFQHGCVLHETEANRGNGRTRVGVTDVEGSLVRAPCREPRRGATRLGMPGSKVDRSPG